MKIYNFKNIVLLTFLYLFGANQYSLAQNPNKKDTVFVNDTSFTDNANYGAKDSIYVDLINEKIFLYGEAYLDFMGTKLNAGFIELDMKKNEVFASYIFDKDSNRIQNPIFESEGEKIEAGKIRYNFKTEKGFIEEVKIKQDELYLYMGTAKRHPDENIHFKNGRFTTCELEDPHYHFHLSKAVLVPDKRIVTGPMNLWVKGVPTPFGLPFSVIPQSKTRTTGLLFPQIVPSSAYGFGVRDLGYYFPINNSLNTNSYLTLFSRGTWGLKQETNYNYIYKSRGNIIFELQQLRSGFPNYSKNNKINFQWRHQKDTKSNPYWTFSSNVNFVSDNNTQNNLDPLNNDFLNNQLNSDINLQRLFPGKPITMGLKISARQNTASKTVELKSPTYNINITRFSPLKNVIKNKHEFAQFFSRIAISYNLESQNTTYAIDTFKNQNYFNQLPQNFMNGIQQNATLQSTAAFFKNTLKFTPSVSYSNYVNFQQIQKSYDSTSKTILVNDINRAGMAQNISFTGALTTVMYNYYRIIGKPKPLIRHLITPTVNFSYKPNINQYTVLDTGTVNLNSLTYSPFEKSLYRQGVNQNQGIITFGLNNSMELKFASKKDTVSGFKKVRIIDGLSFTGNYDIFKDSMKLSNISMNLRVSPFKFINIVITSNLSPYRWNDTTGKIYKEFAINSNQGLGRILNTSFNTTLNLTSKESKAKLNDLQSKMGESWNADFNYFYLYPERVIDFQIPWKVNLTHTYSITTNQNISTSNPDKHSFIHTLNLNGDFSFTKRWKIMGNINYDVKTTKISYSTLALSRDMHCWALSFNWIPIGVNKSFLFSIRSTSNMFKDAKLDFRKPPIFF